MKKYEYGRIEKLAQSMADAKIEAGIAAEILEGGESIKTSTKPAVKAEWMKNAMLKMDNLLDGQTCKDVRQHCACCLGGKRLELSRGIAKNNTTFEARIAAANATKFVFGNSVRLLEDGRVLVTFFPDNIEHFRCVCLPKADGIISKTYCYCCGGHVLHHLQIALGRKLECEVISSALESGGTRGCAFAFTVLD